MSSIIDDLWYGNILPDKLSEKEEKKLKRILDEINILEKELNKKLSKDEIKIFENYKLKRDEAFDIYEKEYFKNGFVLGAKFASECLK